MTMAVTVPVRTNPAHEAVWVQVESGFWAGNRTGEFLGTIEARGSGFVAMDSAHRFLGSYAEFEAARDAITGEQ
ncbi:MULTISPECIES: hypothetical protein [unclassified Microbacterium]|uniref:hypothetical protein n=1 Tax=unclassified Microbacterium TaxID=2609290 RepID=UPI00203B527A|nr:hypothetical protein [Microbacterium sp. USTB-Y]